MKKNHRIYTALCAGVLLTTPILTAVSGVQAATTVQAESSQVISSSATSASSVESSQSQSSSQTSSVAPTQSLQPTTEAAQVAVNSASKEKVASVAEVNMDYQKAITAAANQILSTNGAGPWQALAVSRSSVSMTDAQHQAFVNTVSEDIDGMIADDHFSATDLERSAIALTVLGEDATNFHGLNLVDKIIEKATDKYTGINGQIYGIIALSMKDYGEKADAAVDNLIQIVLKEQNTENGWALFGTKSDLDITGMTMTALGMHRDVPGVQDALNKAVVMLKEKAFDKTTGGFLIPGAFTSKENSNSISQTIMGLLSAGIDPAKEFVGDNGVNPISRLLSYQKEDGQFRWLFDSDTGALSMATEQAVYALDQYQFFLEGKGSIYNFGGSDTTDPTDPVTPTDDIDKRVQKSLDLTKTSVKSLIGTEMGDKNFSGSDIVFGAGRTDQLSKTQIQALYEQIVAQSKAGEITRPNDLARVILNLQAMGVDPTNFDGRNLVNELYESKTATTMGAYMNANVLLALVSGHYEAPKKAVFTVKDLMKMMVTESENYGNEGWGYSNDGVWIKDVDTTAISILALKTTLLANDTYHLDDAFVDKTNILLEKASDFIESSAELDGSYGYDGSLVGNANTTALGIAALSLMNRDTNKIFEYKKGSAINALMNFQNEDGSFKADYSVSMATGQALLGLKAYQLYVAKQGSLYDFVKNPVVKYVPTPIADYADVTVQAVDQDGKVLKHATVTHQEVGQIVTVKADQVAVNGYDLKDSATKNVKVAKAGTTVKFVYSKHTTDIKPTTKYADVTIQAIDSTGKAIKTVKMDHLEVGQTITIKASQLSVDGYILKDDDTKTITITKEGNTVKFKYVKQGVSMGDKDAKTSSQRTDEGDRPSNRTDEDDSQTTLPQTGVKTAVISVAVGLIILVGVVGVWIKNDTKKA
ncbi:MAG: MucBP domain-containing protein [Bacillota bacterium]|nr:MucBP domain-containing protein [Bacillota bacterium]